MNITCPGCNAIVPAENIHLAEKIAKCSSCNSVFNCADQLSSITGNNNGYGGFFHSKSEVQLPKRMSAGQVDLGYQITIKWFSPKFIFFLIFCLFWDGILSVFVFTFISQGEPHMILILSVHGLAGLGLTYYTIAGFLNTTIISIAGDQISVKMTPLPWFGMKTINAAGMQQFYCKQKISRGRNSTTITYEVHVKSADSGDYKLIAGLDKEEQAFFIEQEIEKYLGIKDVPVQGELMR